MIHESGIVWTGAAMCSLHHLHLITKSWRREIGPWKDDMRKHNSEYKAKVQWLDTTENGIRGVFTRCRFSGKNARGIRVNDG
jgi:hypothetical protein